MAEAGAGRCRAAFERVCGGAKATGAPLHPGGAACTLELPGRGRGRRGMASSQGGVEQALWHQPPTGLWPSTGRLAVRTTR